MLNTTTLPPKTKHHVVTGDFVELIDCITPEGEDLFGKWEVLGYKNYDGIRFLFCTKNGMEILVPQASVKLYKKE